jgi:hypothetical protein
MDRRHRARGVIPAAVVLAVTAAKGEAGPGLGLAVVVGAFGASIVGALRGRATRHNTDERARSITQQAGAFALNVVGAALTGLLFWTFTRQGIRAAEPYFYLMSLLVVSHVGAVLWLRRRG